MPIITNFNPTPKGQDLVFEATVVDDNGDATTENISAWTFVLEARTSWATADTIFANTSPTINNTTKKVTFTVAKALTQSVAGRRYVWQIRRTNSGSDKCLGYGELPLISPPPYGVAA